jgi:hypothetical protein
MAAYRNGQLVRLTVTHTCTATPVSQPYTTTTVTAYAFGHTHAPPTPHHPHKCTIVHKCTAAHGTYLQTVLDVRRGRCCSGRGVQRHRGLGHSGARCCRVDTCVIVISVKCWVWCVVCAVTADPERGRRINRIAQYRRIGHRCWGGTSNRVLSSACAIPFSGLVDFRC